MTSPVTHLPPASDGTATARRRAAVRRLSSAVSVLTVAAEGTVHGSTVSAVTAVSRDPLLISACLSHGSRLTRLVKCRMSFVVNVLPSRQAPLADWFADPARPAGRAQFDPVGWQPDAASGAPVLRRTLAWFSCVLVDCLVAGDHDILLAEVVDGATGAGNPLLSYDSGLLGADLHHVPRRRGRSPFDVSSLD